MKQSSNLDCGDRMLKRKDEANEAEGEGNSMKKFIAGLCAIAAGLVPTPAHAWGAQGHHLIVEVAYAHLTPSAKAEVDRLLAYGANDQNTVCGIDSLDAASVWPDCVRRRPPFQNEEHWHYVDIPICGDAPPPCANGDCVTAAITAAETTLRNRRAGDHERLLALARLIHFIGDVHQPLHAADNNDRGGNGDHAIFLGSATYRTPDGRDVPNNLHGVWDTPLVSAALGNDDVGARATLEALIAGHEAQWRGGDAQSWATEAHAIAVNFIYAHWPEPLTCGSPAAAPVVIDQAYVDAAAPIVREQLAKAAIRLATELNRDLS